MSDELLEKLQTLFFERVEAIIRAEIKDRKELDYSTLSFEKINRKLENDSDLEMIKKAMVSVAFHEVRVVINVNRED